MLSNSVAKQIRKFIEKDRFIYIDADDGPAIKYIKSEFKSKRVGPVFIFLPFTPSDKGWGTKPVEAGSPEDDDPDDDPDIDDNMGRHDLYTNPYNMMMINDFFNRVVVDAVIYKTKHGLFIIEESDDNGSHNHVQKLKDYAGYIVVGHQKDEAIRREFNGTHFFGVDNETSNCDDSTSNRNNTLRALTFYLLHNNNLYWNTNRKEYRVHDRHLLEYLMPNECGKTTKIRHLKRQWLLVSLIMTIKKLTAKFSYDDPTYWQLVSGKVAPLSEEVDLFHPNKATKTGLTETINPSRFIHQLAAVSDVNVFSVYEKAKSIGGMDTELIPTHSPHLNHQDAIKLDHYNLITDKDFGNIGDNNGESQDSAYTNYIWGYLDEYGLAPTDEDSEDLEVNVLYDRIAMFKPKLLQKFPYQDIVFENKAEFEFYAGIAQKAFPAGCTYNCVKMGKHLFDLVFQPNEPEFSNRYPTAHLPILAYSLMDPNISRHFSATIRTNQPMGICFGNPRYMRYQLVDRKSLIQLQDPDYFYRSGLAGGIDDGDNLHYSYYNISNFAIVRRDLALRQSDDMDTKDRAGNWLKKNHGYRKFITQI